MRDHSRAKRLSLLVIPTLASVAMVVALYQTALFQLNPLKTGYRRFDFPDCVVYSKESVDSSMYTAMSALLSRNEETHALRYTMKTTVVVCSKQSDIDKYLPLVDKSSRRIAGSFAEWPDTVYLTPKSRQQYGSSPGPLTHELSHLLLIQNFGVLKIAYIQWFQEWIPEGFATYLAGFPDYFPPDQLKGKAAETGVDMSNGRLFGAKRHADVSFKVRFMIYRGFVAYLFQTYSRESVLRFLKEVCAKPTKVNAAFLGCFNTIFEDCVREFWKEL